jgi:hypothetical protein
VRKLAGNWIRGLDHWLRFDGKKGEKERLIPTASDEITPTATCLCKSMV